MRRVARIGTHGETEVDQLVPSPPLIVSPFHASNPETRKITYTPFLRFVPLSPLPIVLGLHAQVKTTTTGIRVSPRNF